MSLNNLKDGELGVVYKVLAPSKIKRRLSEMGIIKGQKIKKIKSAPFKDPAEYAVLGMRICLRLCETKFIIVKYLKKE